MAVFSPLVGTRLFILEEEAPTSNSPKVPFLSLSPSLSFCVFVCLCVCFVCMQRSQTRYLVSVCVCVCVVFWCLLCGVASWLDSLEISDFALTFVNWRHIHLVLWFVSFVLSFFLPFFLAISLDFMSIFLCFCSLSLVSVRGITVYTVFGL